VSELGPNAHGEHLDPGRVADCALALPPAADGAGPGGVLVVAPRAETDQHEDEQDGDQHGASCPRQRWRTSGTG
jgi:hypothetical protein